jgi:SAM-dependent methyltransferase
MKPILTYEINLKSEYKSSFLNHLSKKFKIIDSIISRFPYSIYSKLIDYDYSLNERIVEIPFLFKGISQLPIKSKILDVGCNYSLNSLRLSSLGYDVYGIDLNDCWFKHSNFKFVKGDITNTEFEDNFFDCVIAISTLEHIGYTEYGGSRDIDDFLAVKEMKRILKKDGFFIMTAPYGRGGEVKGFERIYNSERIEKLLYDFEIINEEFYFRKSDKEWIRVDKEFLKDKSLDKKGRILGCIGVLAKNKKD